MLDSETWNRDGTNWKWNSRFEKFHASERTIRGSGCLSSLHAIHGHRWGVAKWSNNNQAARVWRIRYILRNITAPLSDRASSSLYSNSHPFNPFNSRRSQAWHLDTLSLRIGTNGYIAICTVATINLPPSITALERDSPIYERLPLRPRMLHAWIVSARLFSPYAAPREFIRPGCWIPLLSTEL